MVEVKVESHKVGVTSYRLTPFSFHVNQPSHSGDTTFSKFDLENPRSRSWVRGKLKVTTWVQHSIDSHPFHPMSIGHPIPEIRLFQNLTLKIQGQGHGWGQSWKSQSGCNILSTHIPFVQCQSTLQFLRYSIFIIWPWKSKVKVMSEGKLKVTTWVQHSIDSHPFHPMSIGHPIPEIWLFQNLTLKIQGQGHGWGESSNSQSECNILSTHIPFVPCQSALPFLRYSIFKIWPWKSKVKVMGEVDIESHNMGPTFYRLTSLQFHVNRPSHTWDMTFSKFDLENPRSR